MSASMDKLCLKDFSERMTCEIFNLTRYKSTKCGMTNVRLREQFEKGCFTYKRN